jgi:hypothetical protein
MLHGDYRGLDGIRFIALVFVALALIPAGAHLFEMPNKLVLAPEQYMVVQQIYRGWALFGIVVFGALLATAVHTALVRHQPFAFSLSLAAFLCLAATRVIFWRYTYPANAATNNWTVTPADFESIRRQWEYSHAVNAGLTFVAFCAPVVSTLESRNRGRPAKTDES